VTQTAEVAVNKAVSRGAPPGPARATGSISTAVPIAIAIRKAVGTSRAGCLIPRSRKVRSDQPVSHSQLCGALRPEASHPPSRDGQRRPGTGGEGAETGHCIIENLPTAATEGELSQGRSRYRRRS
jgi:hypothetical protein